LGFFFGVDGNMLKFLRVHGDYKILYVGGKEKIEKRMALNN